MSIRFSGGVGVGTLGGPSSLNLSDLHDVSISDPTGGQYLRFNGATLEWNNASFSDQTISPGSVTAIGVVTGSNLSGTNTGDQTIVLSGDVSGTGIGPITTTLATINSSTGVFGSATNVASLTTNGKGLITNASNIPIAIGANQVTSGTFADARIAASNITQHQAVLSITEAQIADGTILARLASNDTITGNWTFNNPVSVANPLTGAQVATKQYVDDLVSGVSWKQAAVVATTANIALTGLQTIDGVAVVAGNRVLVKDQTTTSQNGVYVASATAWIRSTDMDSTTPVNEIDNAAVFVNQGTTQAGTGWTQTATVVNLGTDPIVFAQFNGASSITAGNGLTKTGNVIDVVGTAGRIVSNVDNIDLATVTNAGGGTFQKISTDTFGRVTGTSAVVAADITGLVDSTYVNVSGDTMTGPLLLPLGSLSASSLAFTADSNTGLYSPGADLLGFSTGGAERMRVNGLGNVLIGTTGFYSSHSAPLTLNYTGQVGQYGLVLNTPDVTSSLSRAIDFLAGGDASGGGTLALRGHISQSNSQLVLNSQLILGLEAATVLSLRTNGTEKMQINTSGRVGVGVVPNPNWGAAFFKTVDIGNAGCLVGSDTSTRLFTNLYHDGANYRLKTANNQGGVYYVGDGYHSWMTSPTGAVDAISTPVEMMRIDPNGQMGVGTTDLFARITASNSSAGDIAGMVLQNSANNFSGQSVSLYFKNSTWGGNETGKKAFIRYLSTGNFSEQGALLFGTNNGLGVEPQERMRIDAFGNIYSYGSSLLGCTGGWTGNASRLNVCYDGTNSQYGIAVGTPATSGTAIVFLTSAPSAGGSAIAAGNISVNGSSTTYNPASDVRRKKNIKAAFDPGKIIDAMRVCQFDWKDNDLHQSYGFIAQELHEIHPEVVHVGGEDEKANPWGYDPTRLVPMLIKEIQLLRARVLHLEQK